MRFLMIWVNSRSLHLCFRICSHSQSFKNLEMFSLVELEHILTLSYAFKKKQNICREICSGLITLTKNLLNIICDILWWHDCLFCGGFSLLSIVWQILVEFHLGNPPKHFNLYLWGFKLFPRFPSYPFKTRVLLLLSLVCCWGFPDPYLLFLKRNVLLHSTKCVLRLLDLGNLIKNRYSANFSFSC